MVARLQHWKGVHVFIDAVAQVAGRRPEAHFLVVGGTLFGLEKRYDHELRARVASLGLDGTVTFAGHRSDVDRFFAAADVVVHASIEPEPFGMVLVEAMAWGKPVIASDSGGPREIVRHGETGLLVPPNDPALLAHALIRLIEDSELRNRMGKAGAARFKEAFLASRMTRELEEAYEEVASTPRLEEGMHR